MSIKNKQELNKKLNEIAQHGIEKLASEVKIAWQNYIKTKFYDEYSPNWYERTYDLLNSVVTTEVYKSGGLWKIDIFMDDNSVLYQNDNSNFVFQLASQGIHGLPESGKNGWINSNFIQTEGGFYEAILEDLKTGVFEKEFSKILKNMGLTLSRI